MGNRGGGEENEIHEKIKDRTWFALEARRWVPLNPRRPAATVSVVWQACKLFSYTPDSSIVSGRRIDDVPRSIPALKRMDQSLSGVLTEDGGRPPVLADWDRSSPKIGGSSTNLERLLAGCPFPF